MAMTTKARKKATKTARRAGKEARKRAADAGDTAQERAAELAELAERAGALAQERAHLLAERLRDSEALVRAQVRGSELADLAQMKGSELSGLAKSKWRESDLDERAAALAKQFRQAAATKKASKRARELSDTTLAALGGWLVGGPAAGKLGVAKKPRVAGWLWAVLGAGLGFAAAKLLVGKSDMAMRDDLTSAADRLADQAPHPAGTVLADTIRMTLQDDPRTAKLQQLNINVAEGTVFVRGDIPSGIDSDSVRQVIRSIPGVEDVDLQLTPAM